MDNPDVLKLVHRHSVWMIRISVFVQTHIYDSFLTSQLRKDPGRHLRNFMDFFLHGTPLLRLCNYADVKYVISSLSELFMTETIIDVCLYIKLF
jgi:hypothetical protein